MKFVFWCLTLAAWGFVLVALTGCSVIPEKPAVAVVADTYCATVKKRTWSVNDTPESIQEAVRVNAGIDRACGTKEKAQRPTS